MTADARKKKERTWTLAAVVILWIAVVAVLFSDPQSVFSIPLPDGTDYAVRPIQLEDADLQSVTGGVIPPYRNPDLDGLYGDEQRRTAGGAHAKGIMEKCTFCVHRVEKGLDPACVATCPTDALVFGDTDDATSPISVYLRAKRTWRLLEEAGTNPSVYYVGGKAPNKDLREIERPKATV